MGRAKHSDDPVSLDLGSPLWNGSMVLEMPPAWFPARAYHPGRLDLSRDNPMQLTQCCGAAH